jgi:endonuclease G
MTEMTNRDHLLKRRLREIQRSDGIRMEHLEELVAPALKLEAVRGNMPMITSEAMDSWRRFEQDKPLNEQDLFHLESIILGNGLRPAFDIVQDSYEMLPSLWQDLNDRRAIMEPLIRGIGRLDMTGHPMLSYAGTAFLCGERHLITNRHVAACFTQGVGSGAQLSFTTGVTPALDLKQEVGSVSSLIVEITAPALIIDEWDIAVLKVGKLPGNVAPLPLAASAPAGIEERIAALIGYPAFDPSEDLIQQIQIFRSTFNKKRLQPGRLKGMKSADSFGRSVEALAHDCSTLGGNSGSAVIDVDTGKVVGIHFAGQPLIANYAVPTWALASDERVRNSGVEFAA